jgi:uncharacterized membrane protein YheB (UPF0754 family)
MLVRIDKDLPKDSKGKVIKHELKDGELISIDFQDTEKSVNEMFVSLSQLCKDCFNAELLLIAKRNLVNEALKSLTKEELAEYKVLVNKALGK